MAELFESFISDKTFTLPELSEFHAFAKGITKQYNDYMAGEILLAFGEGVLPIFEFVLLETGTTLAIRILQKIPISWVLRGARLNKVVKTTVELGVKGTQEHVNIIATSGPVTKANEMFLSLTKMQYQLPLQMA